MSISAKKRIKRCGVNFKGKCYTEKTKKIMSKKRKGIIWSSRKLDYKKAEEIRDFFNQKPYIKDVGKILGNGKILTYERAFTKKFNEKIWNNF